MFLNKLDEKFIRSVSLWDIICDSDGEIVFDFMKFLFLYDIDIDEEEYFLVFFLVGVY